MQDLVSVLRVALRAVLNLVRKVVHRMLLRQDRMPRRILHRMVLRLHLQVQDVPVHLAKTSVEDAVVVEVA